MVCKNCNQQLNGNEKYCGNCGYKVESNNTNIVDNEKEDKKATIFSIISLLLTFGCPFVNKFLKSTFGSNRITDKILYYEVLIGLVLMILARVKSPKNKLAKFTMWLYVALISLIVIGSIIYAILVVILLAGCIGGLKGF